MQGRVLLPLTVFLQLFSVRTWRLSYPSVLNPDANPYEAAAATAAAVANSKPWTIAADGNAGKATAIIPAPTPTGGWPVLENDPYAAAAATAAAAKAAETGGTVPVPSVDVMLSINKQVEFSSFIFPSHLVSRFFDTNCTNS